MAITGDIFKGLIFGNVNSINYGIYITGEAVYNAPERAVELVSVPNRNGSIAIDQGYWENIEVSYPAGTFAENQVDFAQAISDFRNALASQIGYQRLTDSYNPNEYRMGMFVSALEVTPVQLGQAGQFELKFNCKPQRWLLTGEQPVTVSNHDALVNPTLYDASPLMEVAGTGNIAFNNYNITINNGIYGNVVFYSSGNALQTVTKNITIPNIVNNGDQFVIQRIDFYASTMATLTGGGVTVQGHDFEYGYDVSTHTGYIYITNAVFTVGTATTDGYTKRVYENDGSSQVDLGSILITYDGDRTITLQTTTGLTSPLRIETVWSDFVVNASKHYASETTLFIDCELGECYKFESGEIVGLNAYIDLGSDLPTLASGSNTITFDNTVTDLKITPRWWQL